MELGEKIGPSVPISVDAEFGTLPGKEAADEDVPLSAGQRGSGYGAAGQGCQIAGDEKQSDTLELSRWLHSTARNSFWLTRLVLLRAMGGIYLVAFLTTGLQNRQLLGPRGLFPAQAGPSFTGGAYFFSPFGKEPSEMHGAPYRPTPAFAVLGFTDASIAVVSWTGFLLALVMVTGECTSMLIPAALWLMWLSVVNLGSPFIMGYGWEWQVCETGLLIMCLCHLPGRYCSSWWTSWRKDFPQECPPPYPVLLLLRFLCFRVMIGAGLSKINPLTWKANASHCWEDLTCTATHYETTGAPNPIGYFMHKQPMICHRAEVLLNHVVELIVPWFFLAPFTEVRRFAACISLFFMICIACTGNYAYINHITAVPMLACLDDAFLSGLFSTKTLNEARVADQECGSKECRSWWPYIFSGRWPFDPAVMDQETDIGKPLAAARRVVDFVLRHAIYVGLVFMIIRKSSAPLHKTFGSHPWLEFYDDYFIENSYGVFGFVNTVRVEMTLSYLPYGSKDEWAPLDFHCKPSSLNLMPCVVNPYHDRFDWVTWIHTTASMEDRYLYGEIRSFRVPGHVKIAVSKLLKGDTDAAGMFGTPAHKIFRDGRPPLQVKAELWRYKFSSLSALLSRGEWWEREPLVTGDRAIQNVGSDVAFAEMDSRGSGEISQLPPTHDYLLLTSTMGCFLVALGLHDQPSDFFWNRPGVMLGSYLLIFGLLRTTMPRVFLAHWLAATVVLVTYLRFRVGDVWPVLWKELPNVLPPKISPDDESYCAQVRRFRLLNGVLAFDFLLVFVIAVLVPEASGYWASVVLAVLGVCIFGIGIRHATDYVDGISMGGVLALFALMLEAGRAACFQLPVSPA